MTMPAAPAVPAALRPLAALAQRYPQLEGQVVWLKAGGDFVFQDNSDLGLDPEEFAFYAEGLLAEGFHLVWALLADEADAQEPLILQLTCGEGAPPPPPPLPAGWCLARVAGAVGRAAP